MKYGIYAMRDDFTGFLTPTADSNDNTAIRNFAYAINTEGSVMYAKPEDFSLYKLGVYDTDDGVIETGSDYPMILCRGDSVKERKKNGK